LAHTSAELDASNYPASGGYLFFKAAAFKIVANAVNSKCLHLRRTIRFPKHPKIQVFAQLKHQACYAPMMVSSKRINLFKFGYFKNILILVSLKGVV
jgi:hypothetical protein